MFYLVVAGNGSNGLPPTVGVVIFGPTRKPFVR